MRRGMNSLGLLVQEAFRRDPHGGDLYVFRGKSSKLIKILWHDGLGMSLYTKRLERGRFLWPLSKLLAHVLFAMYGLPLPLHRQSDVYQREGIDPTYRRSRTG